MSAVIVIPARYDSTRFPGKPLAPICGRPMIRHVYEAASRSRLASEVIVATDSAAIFEEVRAFGGKAAMTSVSHPSGADRVAEVARSLAYDIVVNLQGDEPMIRPEMVDDLIGLFNDERVDIGTLVKRIETPREIADPNVVKAVFGEDRFALYFSRSPIPYPRDLGGIPGLPGFPVGLTAASPLPEGACFYKHIGIYGYRREALLRLTGLRPTRLEETERLEQLRALENGFRIKVKETSFEIIGVDTPEDLERIKTWLNSSL